MKIFKSFVFAFNGVKLCWRTETNFKIHLFFTALAVLLGINFHITNTEWQIIVVCTGLVLAMEMLNTAIEKLCDVVYPGRHVQIKQIKDMAAGAVLVSALASCVAGCIIFLPKIIAFINQL